MQGMTKKNLKIGIPMLAAAAAGVWMVPSAKADYIVSYVQTGTSGTNSIYVVEAVNNGLNTSSSTTLLGVDATITTPATGGALVTHIEGVGSKQQVTLDGSFSDNFFGDPTGGTFIGIGDQPLPNPPTAYNDPNGAGSQSLTTASAVFTGTNVNANFFGPVAHGNGAVYKGSKTSTYDSGFTSAGTLHALEVAATLTAGEGVDTSGGAIPIANVVVPTGTIVSINGELSEDVPGSPPQPFQLSFPNTTPVGGAKVSVSSTPQFTVTGTAAVTGNGHGSYNEVTVVPSNGVTGSLSVDPFSPATDEEIYGLRVLEGGGIPTNGDLATIVSEINTQAGSNIASLTPPGTSGTVLPSSFFDIFVDINPGSLSNPYFNYDLSGSATAANNPTIAAIGVVPEPTGVGVLVLGGIGLLARRRRMNQIEA